jgi:hypothetical protein
MDSNYVEILNCIDTLKSPPVYFRLAATPGIYYPDVMDLVNTFEEIISSSPQNYKLIQKTESELDGNPAAFFIYELTNYNGVTTRYKTWFFVNEDNRGFSYQMSFQAKVSDYNDYASAFQDIEESIILYP